MQKAECVDANIGILVTSLRKGGKNKRRIKRLIQNVFLRIANEDTLASF